MRVESYLSICVICRTLPRAKEKSGFLLHCGHPVCRDAVARGAHTNAYRTGWPEITKDDDADFSGQNLSFKPSPSVPLVRPETHIHRGSVSSDLITHAGPYRDA